MGLDMYLTKKSYVKNWDHMTPEERHEIRITKGGGPTNIKPERISEITEQVMTWRKANAIHKWFVDNVQNGEDDCKEYYVTEEQLKELLDLVTLVLKQPTKAKEVLPSADGFFFGGTEYDQWYFQDMEDTKKTLEELLKEPIGTGSFYYQSSW